MVDNTYITRLHGGDYVLILSWLQKNISKVKNSRPIIWWEGTNWYMKLVQGKMADSYVEVHFTTKKHLKLFEDYWAE
jgi:hypothetical protein